MAKGQNVQKSTRAQKHADLYLAICGVLKDLKMRGDREYFQIEYVILCNT